MPPPEDRIARVDLGELGAHDPAAGLVPPHDLGAEAAALSAVLIAAEHDGPATAAALSSLRAALAVEGQSPEDRERALRAALAVVPAPGGTVLDRMLEILKPEHFYSEANGRIWQGVQALAAARTPVDLVTVGRWLSGKGWLAKVGGAAYLAQIADATPSVGHAEEHAWAVVDAYEDRLLIAETARVRAEGYLQRTREERAVWREGVRGALGRATLERVKLAGAPIGVAVQEVRARIKAQIGGQVLGVRWGLRSLDEAFGLAARGRQHVLGGLSEHGKTALAAQVAGCVASTPLDAVGVGEAVYILSGEMPRGPFVHRAACSLANVDATRVELGICTPEELNEIQRALDWLERLPIVIDDEPAEVAAIVPRIREHKRLFETGRARNAKNDLLPKCRMQMVIGDHVQKLARQYSGCGPRAEMKDKIAAVSHGWLTQIAKGLDVATVLLAQLRRDILDPRSKDIWPRSSQLEGASELAQDADTIMLVHRPELVMAAGENEAPDKWRGIAGVVAGKRRWGGTGRVVKLGFQRGIFTEELPRAAAGEPYYERD